MSSTSNTEDQSGSVATQTPSQRRTVVFIDIPDPDNFLLALRAIRENPTNVDVVVTPRPVDFSAEPLGDYVPLMIQGCGEYEKPAPLFAMHATDADKGFDDKEVRKDTGIYTELSILRLQSYLKKCGIQDDQYSLFWRANMDEYTETGQHRRIGLKPVFRHSYHTADFTWDDDKLEELYKTREAKKYEQLKKETGQLTKDETTFCNLHKISKELKTAKDGLDEEKKKLVERKQKLDAEKGKGGAQYDADMAKWEADNNDLDTRKKKHFTKVQTWAKEADYKFNARNSTLREETRKLCAAYIEKTRATHQNLPRSFDDLVAKHHSEKQQPDIYVGGPFTDVVDFVKRARSGAGKIVAQGGATVKGHKYNLMPNQFNFHADMDAAKEILELAQKKEVDLTLVPTEVAKFPDLTFSADDMKFFVDDNTLKLYNKFKSEKPQEPNPIFDLLVVFAAPSKFPKELSSLKLRSAVLAKPSKEMEEEAQSFQKRLRVETAIELIRLERGKSVDTQKSTKGLKAWWVDGLNEGDGPAGEERFCYYHSLNQEQKRAVREWYKGEIEKTCLGPGSKYRLSS